MQVKAVSKAWAQQADLPSHVVTMLNNFPSNVHPMSQLSAAITACNTESKFVQAYNKGAPKGTYWEVRSTPRHPFSIADVSLALPKKGGICATSNGVSDTGNAFDTSEFWKLGFDSVCGRRQGCTTSRVNLSSLKVGRGKIFIMVRKLLFAYCHPCVF